MKKTRAYFVAVLSFAALLAVTFAASYAQVASQSKVFKALGPGGRLLVEVRSGDVQVRAGGSDVVVNAVGVDPEDLQYLRMEQVGDAVEVSFDPRGRVGRVRFEIQVPAAFTLDLSTAGGDVSVENTLTGEVQIKTSGGDIVTADVNGAVQLKTSGGDIKSGRVAGNATLTTAGGDIRLDSAEGEATLKTSGGDIVVGNVGNTLTASTAGGDISVGDVTGEAKLSTAGGDIDVGAVSGSAMLATAGGDVQLRGASGEVDAKTAGGDLELLGVTGSIQGKTAGGDIVAELDPKGSGGSSLKTAGGDISLKLPQSASATVEAVIRIDGNWERESQRVALTSDFPQMQVEKDAARSEIRGVLVIGGGAEKVEVQTVNGNVHIGYLGR